MRFAVVSAYPNDDWHSRQIIHACAGRGSVDVFAPTAFSVQIDGDTAIRAGGRDVRDWDVWLLPRALGVGDADFQCEVYRILGGLCPVVNPVDALLRAEDKVLTSWLLRRAGVRTPACIAAQSLAEALEALAALRTVVAKPPYGSLGIGVEKLSTRDAQALARLEAILERHGLVVLQKFVPTGRRPRDLRLFVIGDQVAGAVVRVAPVGEFRSNVHQGGEARAIDPDREAAELSVAAARALGLVYAGVDVVEDRDGYTVLEVNGTPRWDGILRATGEDMAGHIVAYAAEVAARRKGKRLDRAASP